jgi:hypothetical protein
LLRKRAENEREAKEAKRDSHEHERQLNEELRATASNSWRAWTFVAMPRARASPQRGTTLCAGDSATEDVSGPVAEVLSKLQRVNSQIS